MTALQQLRETLLQTDEEFRRLATQHRDLDSRLGELSRQLYRTGQEEHEKAVLKKRKLQLKDRMEAILRRHSAPAAVPALEPSIRG